MAVSAQFQDFNLTPPAYRKGTPPPSQSWESSAYAPKRIAESLPAAGGASQEAAAISSSSSSSSWRDEVANRVKAHKARRRRYHGDASMSLRFDAEIESNASAAPVTADREEKQELAESAMNPSDDDATYAIPSSISVESKFAEPKNAESNVLTRLAARAVMQTAEGEAETGKLIEFPRASVTEDTLPEELAEPILKHPRIFEMEEAMEETEDAETPEMAAAPEELVSPLEMIHLDGCNANGEEPDWIVNYDDGYDNGLEDYALPVAPMGARALAALLDAALALVAALLFSGIVYGMADFAPRGKMAILYALVLPAGLWIIYQIVFLAYCGATPGMMMAQLELRGFESDYPERRSRVARALALGLCCISLGMGFAWAMVDEDQLGWHDRITRTYLRLR